MEGSRPRILNLLQRHQHATVDQLSRHMDLASATVRRHLDILQRDQLVAYQQVKKKTGRPEYLYYLTEAGQESLPKGYDRILGHLLKEMSSLSQAEVGNRNGEDLLQLLFRRMAQQTAASKHMELQEPLTQRVASAVSILEEEQFQPEVEEVDGSFRILLRNCPFRRVALENQHVCEYDRAILSTILRTDVVREQCIRKGHDTCCYLASAVDKSA